MLKNYLTITIRNLLNHKLYTLINTLGLAVGMACCILVLLFIQYEFSIDQNHTYGDRVYLIHREARQDNGEIRIGPFTSGALGPVFEETFPEVEKTVRIWRSRLWILSKDKAFQHNICAADSDFFDVFPFPFVQGDPTSALHKPQNIVITQEMAQLYFGNEDPIGQTLEIQEKNFQGIYTVAGIIKHIPWTVSGILRFQAIISNFPTERAQDVWNRWERFTAFRPVRIFALMKPDASVDALRAKLPAFMRRVLGEDIQRKEAYRLQSIKRIRLYNPDDVSPSWAMQRIHLYVGIALAVLFIACVNFMNLATARSIHRAREVGMRKVVGARRRQLIAQFLSESLLLAFLSLGLSLLLAYLFLPIFQEFVPRVDFDTTAIQKAFPYLLILTTMTGFIAGSYPAFFMSASQPVSILKGAHSISRGKYIRKGLIIIQFSVSILLLISTFVIQNQIEYMTNRDLGFNKDHVVSLPLFMLDREIKTDWSKRLGYEHERVKQTFLQHPDILEAVACRYIPGVSPGLIRNIRPLDRPDITLRMSTNEVDENFIDLFDLKLTAGRNIQPAGIDSAAFIINQAAVKLLGWENPIGKQVEWLEYNRICTIVGIIEDYQNRSLRDPVAPAALYKQPSLYYNLILKIRPDTFQNILPFLKKTWKQFLPNRPFAYNILEDRIQNHYWEEQQFRRITRVFCFISMFLACLGLFGLAAFTTEQRTREIGIRKVLGASVPNLLGLISADFTRLVLIANLIAWPVGYFYLQDWLNTFVFRIPLTLWPFILGGGLVLLISLLTVSLQAFKAARSNPVDALRHE